MISYFPVVTGSLTVSGSVNISGSITTNSTITATTLVVQTITSSISAITGSTNFGSLSSNTHTFTGSILTSGSVGIGTNNPTYANLQVNAGSFGSNTLLSLSTVDGTYNPRITFKHITSTSPLNHYLEIASGYSTGIGYANVIFPNSSIGIGTSTINLSSGSAGSTVVTISPTTSERNSIIELNGTRTGTNAFSSYIRAFSNNASTPIGDIQFIKGSNDVTGSINLVPGGTGGVGIGTSTPSTTLHLSTTNGIRLQYPGNIGFSQIATDAANNTIFSGYSLEHIRILGSNGNVGIGTSSPSSRLGVKSAGADGLVLEQDSNDATNSSRLFLTGSVQTYGMFNNAGDWRFTYGAQPANTSGTSLARFTNTGKYFRMESGTGGIQFQGNTASTNALNAYEEGSWTPAFDGNGATPSYTHQFGRYTRIGRVVHLVGKIGLSNGTGGGTITITGIPFTAADASDSGQRCSARPEGDWSGFGNATAFNNIMFRISSNSLVAVTCNSGGSSSYIGYNSFSSTLYFNFNVTYYV